MDAAFVKAIVKTIFSSKQISCPISSTPVAVKSTDREDSSIADVVYMAKHLQCCRVAKMVRVPAIPQIPLLPWASATKLRLANSHPHLARRRLLMVARGLCNVTVDHPFTFSVAIWSKPGITLPNIIRDAHCTASSNSQWSLPANCNSVNMVQMYTEAETTEKKFV